jgi:hypothetical protein
VICSNVIEVRGNAGHLDLLPNRQLSDRDFRSQKQATRSLNSALEKVREEDDVELVRCASRICTGFCGGLRHPAFSLRLRRQGRLHVTALPASYCGMAHASSPSLPSEPRIQPYEAESRHLQSQQMQPSFILHFLSTYFLVCIAERSRNTLHCLILRSNEFPVAEL